MFPSVDQVGKCTVFNINGKSGVKMTQLLENTVNYWPLVAQVLSVPQTKADYQRTVTLLDELVDIVGDDESHSLTSLMDTLSLLVESYENEHYPITDVSAKEVLQSIMQEHGLQESDFPEIGDQHQVLGILNGEQELNSQQICALSKRFHVSHLVLS
jgi:HTH-type transcriptional regulator/antitoxin HigA